MTILAPAAWLLALGFAVWRLGRRFQFFFHIHQLEGYAGASFLRWVVARPLDVLIRKSHAAGALIVVGLVWFDIPVILALVLWSVAFASSRRYRRDRPKKPLAWTPRMKREAVAASALALLTVLLVGTWAGTPASWLAGLGLADLLAPLLVFLAGVMMSPVEASIREGFKREARRRLAARPDLTVVAITGSYGKTSVKFAVAEVLAQRFQVLATPGSFNTPMGICKVINNDLQDHHQVLILEMGIRHPGDIAELCQIARPDIAVVTGIGIAHLETMGTRDAIAREKGTLLDFLKPDGRAVLNADDDYFEEMQGRVPYASVSASGRPATLTATGVGFGPDGTHFRAVSDQEAVDVRLRLLGRHHVHNSLLALAVGQMLGIRLRSAAHALARQAPVPHRLSLREEGGLLILDDAFNSNPVGARGAVEVLEQFAPRTRFVITPGMVELGLREFEENHAWGRYMAGRADHVILVGPARTAAIAAGLQEGAMHPDAIHVVQTLFEARETLQQLAQPGDVVLYENDLPDQYTEA